jgi:hypothetical protein
MMVDPDFFHFQVSKTKPKNMAKPILTIPADSKKKKAEQVDDLAGDVLVGLNKKFKDVPSAFTYLSGANLVKEWVSTGADMLDLAISNRPNGG